MGIAFVIARFSQMHYENTVGYTFTGMDGIYARYYVICVSAFELDGVRS